MIHEANQFKFLSLFKKWSTIILLAALIVQLIIFDVFKIQVFPCLIALLGWFLTLQFLLTPSVIYHNTLSFMVMFGLSITQFFMPPVFILLEGKPLTYNLDYPNSVSLHNFLAFIVLLISFYFYRTFFKTIRDKLTSFYQRKTSLLKPPTNSELWIMGIIALISFTFSKLINGSYQSSAYDSNASVFNKFLEGFIPYISIPLYIFIKKLYTPNFFKEELKVTPFVLYIILIIILGTMSNSRGFFMVGVTGLGFAYMLGLFLGKFSYRVFTVKNLSFAMLGFYLLTGPISDLGVAMVVNRTIRSDISPSELFSRTLDVYQDKELLRKARILAKLDNLDSEWDESYFDNIFLARFSNPKFNDLSLAQAYKLGNTDPIFLNLLIDKIWTTFPNPIINFFGIELDKEKVNGGSIGDFLFERSSGSFTAGFRTGHFAGVGMASFGWGYLPLLGILIIPYFILLDSLIININGQKFLSILSLSFLLINFTYFGTSSASESITSLIPFYIRGFLERLLLYMLLYTLARKISSLIFN